MASRRSYVGFSATLEAQRRVGILVFLTVVGWSRILQFVAAVSHNVEQQVLEGASEDRVAYWNRLSRLCPCLVGLGLDQECHVL